MQKQDKRKRRCPKLGSIVELKYCRKHADEKNGICSKIYDCWWEEFDIQDYLKKTTPEETLNKIKNSNTQPKVLSLVELIQKAKRRIS